MNKLPGIIDFAFDTLTNRATVTYDPTQVSEDAVCNAIDRSNQEMVEDDSAASDADLLLTPKQENDAPGTR